VELLSAPLAVAAATLVLAGALKVLDPAPTVGALRQLGLPVNDPAIRAVAVLEIAIGCAALVAGGPVATALVAASYAVATVVVVAALRAGTMISSCGCFGRDDTPPDSAHVVVNLALGTAAGVAAVSGAPAPWDALADAGLVLGGLTLGLVVLGTWLVVLVYTVLGRTRAAARAAAEVRAARARSVATGAGAGTTVAFRQGSTPGEAA
jgi:hypothetical protein